MGVKKKKNTVREAVFPRQAAHKGDKTNTHAELMLNKHRL